MFNYLLLLLITTYLPKMSLIIKQHMILEKEVNININVCEPIRANICSDHSYMYSRSFEMCITLQKIFHMVIDKIKEIKIVK